MRTEAGTDFGSDTTKYFDEFISSPVEPVIYTGIVIITAFFLFFGITNMVEKVTKAMMQAL